MKRRAMALAVLLASAFGAQAQDGTTGAASTAQQAASAPAAAELTRLLEEFLAGASRNDVTVHERFWADELIYTRSAGVRMGKAEILENARSGPTAPPAEPTHYSAEDVRIQQYGDTAVVAFRLVGTTTGKGQSLTTQFLNTGTFVKRNGEWRAVAWQSTRIPDSEANASQPTGNTNGEIVDTSVVPFTQGW